MRKKWLLSILLAGLVLLTAGCSATEPMGDPNAETMKTGNDAVFERGTICLYYTNETSDALYQTEQEMDLSGKKSLAKARSVIGALIDAEGAIREKASWRSVIPAGSIANIVYQKNMEEIAQGAKLQIVLTDIYTTMTQNQRVLLQTGISQAIFQLKIVEAVEFILADQVVCRINSTQEFAINEYDEEFFSGSVAVNLYFANSAGTALKRERRELTLGLTDSLSYAMVEALIRGPEQADLLPTIPVGTKINVKFIKDGACYLDLSQEFQKNYIGGETMEQLTIFSLVNSLCGLPGINRVQILIDGRRVETYKFSVPLNSFFDRDLTLVE